MVTSAEKVAQYEQFYAGTQRYNPVTGTMQTEAQISVAPSPTTGMGYLPTPTGIIPMQYVTPGEAAAAEAEKKAAAEVAAGRETLQRPELIPKPTEEQIQTAIKKQATMIIYTPEGLMTYDPIYGSITRLGKSGEIVSREAMPGYGTLMPTSEAKALGIVKEKTYIQKYGAEAAKMIFGTPVQEPTSYIVSNALVEKFREEKRAEEGVTAEMKRLEGLQGFEISKAYAEGALAEGPFSAVGSVFQTLLQPWVTPWKPGETVEQVSTRAVEIERRRQAERQLAYQKMTGMDIAFGWTSQISSAVGGGYMLGGTSKALSILAPTAGRALGGVLTAAAVVHIGVPALFGDYSESIKRTGTLVAAWPFMSFGAAKGAARVGAAHTGPKPSPKVRTKTYAEAVRGWKEPITNKIMQSRLAETVQLGKGKATIVWEKIRGPMGEDVITSLRGSDIYFKPTVKTFLKKLVGVEPKIEEYGIGSEWFTGSAVSMGLGGTAIEQTVETSGFLGKGGITEFAEDLTSRELSSGLSGWMRVSSEWKKPFSTGVGVGTSWAELAAETTKQLGGSRIAYEGNIGYLTSDKLPPRVQQMFGEGAEVQASMRRYRTSDFMGFGKVGERALERMITSASGGGRGGVSLFRPSSELSLPSSGLELPAGKVAEFARVGKMTMSGFFSSFQPYAERKEVAEEQIYIMPEISAQFGAPASISLSDVLRGRQTKQLQSQIQQRQRLQAQQLLQGGILSQLQTQTQARAQTQQLLQGSLLGQLQTIITPTITPPFTPTITPPSPIPSWYPSLGITGRKEPKKPRLHKPRAYRYVPSILGSELARGPRRMFIRKAPSEVGAGVVGVRLPVAGSGWKKLDRFFEGFVHSPSYFEQTRPRRARRRK